jgi:arylsulfatase A-like enzyme
MQVGWDHHVRIAERHPSDCWAVDQPSAALVTDLKQRGLLDDTLVVFGGEFGRTVYAQGGINPDSGRDHHGGNFTMWMTGGGFKPGAHYGRTDDFSYNVVENPVTIHDLHATMLYLMGIDHKQLTYHYQGRDYRLTDVYGQVIQGIVA